MQLLVNGKLHKTTLESPGIVVALNVLPLNKTLVEAATLRYVQNVLREGFNGHTNLVHHQKLVATLEPIGGLAKVERDQSRVFPGLIAANAGPLNWKYECRTDLLGIMIDEFVKRRVFDCVQRSVFIDKFEHEHIFNVKQQTAQRAEHVAESLRRIMELIAGAECHFNPGEVDENGDVNLFYGFKYSSPSAYGPGPHLRGKIGERETWNNWMKLNFIRHEIHGRPMTEIPRLEAAQQWLPDLK